MCNCEYMYVQAKEMLTGIIEVSITSVHTY